ncbi:MAG TPA: glycine betaine ABC transporter substrate-binding protein [Dongiaceae bacterium]|nr:glycine betaine ABC transporter substrate-binding protein [Dongiaceae bacterium]
MMRRPMRRLFALALAFGVLLMASCGGAKRQHIVVASKFFTEQVILAELLAQHIEARTGIPVERKANLGGTLLVQKALLSGDVDLYVEYTGTALTAVLGESPAGDSAEIYKRVKQQYAQRFALEVTDPLGFANAFAMVVRGDDARSLHLANMSELAPVAPRWRLGVGYEFLERPDGYRGWTQKYGLRFGEQPRVLDLGLLYRALAEKKVDIVAGNSTDGLIDALGFVPLRDDRHYFPPYDAVPVVRKATLEKFPQLRGALADLAGKVTEDDMRRMNREVDADQKDVVAVVREFRAAKGL